MAVSHIKNVTVADGTNTNIVRPGDWNSVHNQYMTLAGNTAGASTLSGTNIVFQGGNNITLSATDQTLIISGGAGGAGAGLGESVGTVAGTDLGLTVNTDGVSILYPKWITTYVNDLTSGRAGVGETVGTIAGTDLAMTVDTAGVNIGYPKWITTYVAQTNQTIGLYASSNTTLTSSGTVDARSLSFRGIGGVTVGYSAGEVLLSGAAGGATAATLQAWKRHIAWQSNQTGMGTTDKAFHVFPLIPTGDAFQGVMTVNTVGILMSWSTAATTVSQSLSSTINIGIYTLNGSTLSLLNSAVGTFGNTSDLTVNGSNRWDGLRLLTLGSGDNLTWSAAATFSGAPYWMGFGFISAITTIAASLPYGGDPVATAWVGVQGNSATNATNHPFFPFHGVYSATTAAPPASITRGDITGFRSDAARLNPWIEFNNLWIP